MNLQAANQGSNTNHLFQSTSGFGGAVIYCRMCHQSGSWCRLDDNSSEIQLESEFSGRPCAVIPISRASSIYGTVQNGFNKIQVRHQHPGTEKLTLDRASKPAQLFLS